MQRVVIVGGGAAGVWAAACLADRGISGIDIVDPSQQLGRGLAYAGDDSNHLLNVTADKMDPHPVAGCETFVSWLSKHHPEFVSGYCPRHIFGAYMADVVRDLRAKTRLRHHSSLATSLTADAAGLTVGLQDGSHLTADHVVLAVGNLPPRQISRALQHPRIMEDPWRLNAALIRDARTIVVAGTGLTAADVAISVSAIAPEASITLAANRPFMPPADATVANWPGANAIPATRPSQTWRYIIREVRSNPTPHHWISVIEATKSVAPRIWSAWSPQDKATFVRHGLRHWLHHRHRMPRPSYELIQHLLKTGRLEVGRGRIGNIELRDDKVHLTIGTRSTTADVLINATGPSVDLNASPILKVAAANGLISGDAYGLGIAASPSGQAIGSNGEPTPGLWVLGAWTRSTHFEVVAVPLIRKHASMIAEAITSPVAQRAIDRG
jgi:uncharacterized NAD(P)/FAD-binding protein YdhS